MLYVSIPAKNSPSKMLDVGFNSMFLTSHKVRDFFTKERGSIVVSEAVCLTHKVDIADR